MDSVSSNSTTLCQLQICVSQNQWQSKNLLFPLFNLFLKIIKHFLSFWDLIVKLKFIEKYSSMTLLLYYLAPLQNDTVVTARCMQFIFGGKVEATCLIRECPLWLKKKGREREKEHQALDEKYIKNNNSMNEWMNEWMNKRFWIPVIRPSSVF